MGGIVFVHMGSSLSITKTILLKRFNWTEKELPVENTHQQNISKVEKSSEEFMEIMQNLSSIQVCFFWHIIFHTSVTPLEKE